MHVERAYEVQEILASFLASMESRNTLFRPCYLGCCLFSSGRQAFLMLEQVVQMPCRIFILFNLLRLFFRYISYGRILMGSNTVSMFLVVVFVKSIYWIKWKKKERNAYNTKYDKFSAVSAAMTVLLERNFTGNERNSHFIVSALTAYLLIHLFIPVHIFKLASVIIVYWTKVCFKHTTSSLTLQPCQSRG